MTNDYSTLNTSGSNHVQLMGKQYLVTTATAFSGDPAWRVIITETLQTGRGLAERAPVLEGMARQPGDQEHVGGNPPASSEGGHPHREPNVRRSYALTVYPDGRWVIDVRQYGLMSGWLEQMCTMEMGTIRWHYIVENANRPRLAPGSGLIPSSYSSFNNSFITEITATDRGFSVVFIQSHQTSAPYVPTIFGWGVERIPFHPVQIPAPITPVWGSPGERRKCEIRFDMDTDLFTVEFD